MHLGFITKHSIRKGYCGNENKLQFEGNNNKHVIYACILLLISCK